MKNYMKYSNSIALALTTLSTFALSSHATIIVNDTWADGDRTSSGPDGGGIDSQWFSFSRSIIDRSRCWNHASDHRRWFALRDNLFYITNACQLGRSVKSYLGLYSQHHHG